MALITDATFNDLRETLGLSKSKGVTESRTRSYREPGVIQIPGAFFPHADFEDALWIKIRAKKISNIKTGGRGGTLTISQHGPVWKFLAPDEIVEVHNHGWEPYDSFHSKLLEKIRALHVGVDQFSEIVNNTLKEIKDFNGAGGYKGILQKVETAVKNASVTTVPQTKIDTPLVYMSSDRRRYDFSFILADPDGATVVQAIKSLQKYAAPDSVDEFRIDFPWVFEVTTDPPGLLNVSYAAITSIQPTYQVPFVNGNPIKAELQLSFEDLSPLFKKTIEDGTIIHVEETAERTGITVQQTGEARQRETERILTTG